MRKIIKYFYFFAAIAGLAFFNSGCDDNSTSPLPVNELAPPTNVRIIVDANAGGGSYATVSWTSSTDEANSDFKGYAVVTDSVSTTGTRLGNFDSSFVNKSQSDQDNITSIIRGKLFRTSVYAVNNDNEKSESAVTVIYSGVYVGTGEIDEFSTSSTTMSGYGWETTTGFGTQSSYISANAAMIDLHLRDASGTLTFYSPDAAPSPITSGRITKFALLGTGVDNYNKPIATYSDQTEPAASSISVQDDNVYLLKTQDNVYIKIWVKEITGTTFQTVSFDYKVQPVVNLKLLK